MGNVRETESISRIWINYTNSLKSHPIFEVLASLVRLTNISTHMRGCSTSRPSANVRSWEMPPMNRKWNLQFFTTTFTENEKAEICGLIQLFTYNYETFR